MAPRHEQSEQHAKRMSMASIAGVLAEISDLSKGRDV